MFGHRYFGRAFFGPRYWGDGGSLPPSIIFGPSDTSDPLFYDHWRRIAEREKARHAVTALQRDEPDEEIEDGAKEKPARHHRTKVLSARPPSRAVVEQLAGVRTRHELEALKPADPPYIAALIAEYERLVAIERELEAEEDEIETLMMVMMA